MYEAHFNMKTHPFRLNPDAHLFYAGKKHAKALSYLEFGLQQAEGFLLVTGDSGTGKTLLLQVLEQELGSRYCVSRINATTKLTATELLKLIAMGFGLGETPDEKISLLNALNAHFRKNLNPQRRGLILIDESHHLSAAALEELRLLTNFQYRGVYLLQCFLVGQSSLRTTLADPGLHQLSQRITAACHLLPLDELETRAYIEARLAFAGCQKPGLFSKDSVAVIHKFTMGVPRRINRVCERALISAAINEQFIINKNCVCEVIEELSDEMEAQFDMAENRNFEFDFSDVTLAAKNKNVIPINDIELKHTNLARYRNSVPQKNRSLAFDRFAAVSGIFYHRESWSKHNALVSVVAGENRGPNIEINNSDAVNQLQYLIQSKAGYKKSGIAVPNKQYDTIKLIKFSQGLMWSLKKRACKINNSLSQNKKMTGSFLLAGLMIVLMVFQESFLRIGTIATIAKNPGFVDEAAVDIHSNNFKIFPELLDDGLPVSKINDEEIKPTRPVEEPFNEVKVLAGFSEVKKMPHSLLDDISADKSKLNTTKNSVVSIRKISILPGPEVQTLAPDAANESEVNKSIAATESQTLQESLKLMASETLASVNDADLNVQPAQPNDVNRINEMLGSDIETVLQKYTSAYRDANLENIADVLNDNIKTEDLSSKKSLISEYKKLFNITEKRSIDFADVTWNKTNESAIGKGRFAVSIIEKGRLKEKTYNGEVTLHLIKDYPNISITELYYAYDN